MLTYHSSAESVAQMMKATEAQRMEGMKPWFAWKAKVGDHLLDFGSPVMGGAQLAKDGSAKPSTNLVSGYSIMQAKDMAEAQSLLTAHPHNDPANGQYIEVHECIAM